MLNVFGAVQELFCCQYFFCMCGSTCSTKVGFDECLGSLRCRLSYITDLPESVCPLWPLTHLLIRSLRPERISLMEVRADRTHLSLSVIHLYIILCSLSSVFCLYLLPISITHLFFFSLPLTEVRCPLFLRPEVMTHVLLSTSCQQISIPLYFKLSQTLPLCF